MMKKLLIIAMLALFTLPCFVQAGQFLSMEVSPVSDKLTLYPKSSLCFHDGSVGEIIFEISYDGNIYVNPNIPLKNIAKQVFEMIDEQFYWAKDKCEQENKELKKRIKDLEMDYNNLLEWAGKLEHPNQLLDITDKEKRNK